MSRLVVIVVLALGAAAACGQKGPLYLPGQPAKNAPWPPPTQPVPQPDSSENKK